MLRSIKYLPGNRLELERSALPFFLFLVYIISVLLHVPARLPFLGVVRIDLLLVAAISFLIFSDKTSKSNKLDQASKYLLSIFIYTIVVLPFVEWPGSVINRGLPEFIKGAIFYFFAVNLILSEDRLKKFLAVFLSCNVVRVFEPLYLNLTQGYWGSRTHLGYGEFAERLSGAPSDVINPNGLAFVIATIFPFLHYVYAGTNKKSFVIYVILVPVLLYAMLLTLSRSGFLAVGIIAFGIFLKSSRKGMLIIIGISGMVALFSIMNDTQKDRYLSIVSDDQKSSASAEGRISGWSEDFAVAMNRPILGHGLGTSREANWNVSGRDQISHILWAEVWQEIGLVGLVLFVLYLKTMVGNFLQAGRLVKNSLETNDFLYRTVEAMQVWLLMNLLFSLASYGLKSYEWYLFGGLSVVLLNLTREKIARQEEKDHETVPQESRTEKYPLRRRIQH